ncbi:MAG: hypothetical protein QM831_08770 [Kofleriaceae bacterium]
MRTLRLLDIGIAKDRISATCGIDDLTFSFSIWYQDIDLTKLPNIERVAFHVAMFQINAVASLAPNNISVGRYAEFASPAFVKLWRTVFEKVWAQWRWEHQRPDYVPDFVDANGTSGTPSKVAAGPVELLAFCGGGKDSLVALRLLERAGLPFSTLGYSHSIYGAAAPQHALLDRVADKTARVRAERQWIYDDFLDSPVVQMRGSALGIKSLTAAETPASVFAALPIAIARGYKHLVLAHEASANSGNLTWGATGEEVNHQWGKSFEAERLLATYVQHELCDVDYWSVLQPVHDELIFELLARDAELAPLTHSCNIAKPWCGTCAKCAYVWLQMSAHLPPAIVQQTFGRDLGALPENEIWFRQLLGLAEHSPFECVGSPAEARLALSLLPTKSKLLDQLAREVGAIDAKQLAAPLVELNAEHSIPKHVAERVLPIFADAARSAKARLRL